MSPRPNRPTDPAEASSARAGERKRRYRTAAASGDSHWQGSLTLGTGWALFVGRSGESSEHAHRAIQLCVTAGAPLELVLDGRSSRPAAACLIPSGRRHALLWQHGVAVLLYLEPESALGAALDLCARPDGAWLSSHPELHRIRSLIGAVERRPLALRDACLGLWADPIGPGPAPRDPRVWAVCSEIRARLAESPLPARVLAASVGLSASRLASLFRAEMGLALRPFVLWSRLERAVDRLAAGRTATEAAHEAGFSDAAHLARTFRRMFGTSISRGLGRVTLLRPPA
jgi:AraC-like DNA-binding protein